MDAINTLFSIKKVQEAFLVLSTLGLTSHLWPKQAAVTDGDRFEFIVVGAGSAGCVVAHRLAELNHVSVLLVEAGGDPPIDSVRPGLFPYLKETQFDWNYYSEEEKGAHKFHRRNRAEVTQGKMLGGSSSLNFMAYTRGHREDYDHWAHLTDDLSWSWKNILKYFTKSEKMLDEAILSSDSMQFHGSRGNMKITKPHFDVSQFFLDAFKEIGHKLVADSNTGDSLGYSEIMDTSAHGQRQSTAQAFLSPMKDKPNLHVLKNSLVTRILFNEKKSAVGVNVWLENKELVNLFANKEVILSAGAINSPHLLMLSGIGRASHLADHSIDVISNLPVGENLQDHVFAAIFQTVGNLTFIPGNNPEKRNLPIIEGYVNLQGKKSKPDYQSLSFIHDANNMLAFCAFYFHYKYELCQEVYEAAENKQVFTSFITLLHPSSRGEILLRSANPFDPPSIYTGYYSDKTDVEKHGQYIEHFLQVQDSSYFRSVQSEVVVPKMCLCDSVYGKKEYYECYARCAMLTGYHASGTCRMGDVVDSKLKVYGVNNLRVADASVMPKIISANTNAATIMIGEKCADMIKKDHFLYIGGGYDY